MAIGIGKIIQSTSVDEEEMKHKKWALRNADSSVSKGRGRANRREWAVCRVGGNTDLIGNNTFMSFGKSAPAITSRVGCGLLISE